MDWENEYVLAFEQVKWSLCNAVELAHCDPANILCVHTDTSDRFRSGIATECDPAELQKPKIEQIHEPLAYLSSQFTTTQKSRATFEKEVFSIYETFK